MIKIDVFAAMVGIVLFLYALIDCAKTEQNQVRGIPKWAWLVLLIVSNVGVLVPIAWLIWGRPKNLNSARRQNRKPRVIPPDDDPDFLRKL
jgi:hypothetical protein